MKHTSKYELSQWEKTDRILMEDFNADNARLESALAAKAAQTDLTAEANARQKADTAEANARQKADTAEAQARQSAVNTINTALARKGNCQIHYVTYTGSGGGTSKETAKSITFPAQPIALCVSNGFNQFLVLRGDGSHTCPGSPSHVPLYFSWEGNTVKWFSANAGAAMDTAGNTYSVIALLEA